MPASAKALHLAAEDAVVEGKLLAEAKKGLVWNVAITLPILAVQDENVMTQSALTAPLGKNAIALTTKFLTEREVVLQKDVPIISMKVTAHANLFAARVPYLVTGEAFPARTATKKPENAKAPDLILTERWVWTSPVLILTLPA